jgi:peptidoglycan/LPS O-acetylase OafA/YrhL
MPALPIQEQVKSNAAAARLFDVDWLRVLAVLLLIPFHTALIFGSGRSDHWIKAEPAPAADLFAHFVHQWHMPLLFLLSGMAAWYALSMRKPGQFRSERVQRLLAPLLLLLLFYPFQAYYWFLYHQNYQGSFLEFYPIPFVAIADFGIAAFWGHLWFLVYLFVFTIVSLPLFAYLRSEAGRPWVDTLAAKGGILFYAIPLAMLEMMLRAGWGNTRNLYADWANFCVYLVLFNYGYLLAADPRLRPAIRRYGWLALGLGMVTFALGLTWLLRGYPNEYAPHNQLSVGWFWYSGLRGFNTWFWLIAILSLGQRFLNVGSALLTYLNEAALPVYILHMPLNVMLGYYVLGWGFDRLTTFGLITLATFVACFVIYEVLIRHFNPIRFVFGLKPQQTKRTLPARQLA